MSNNWAVTVAITVALFRNYRMATSAFYHHKGVRVVSDYKWVQRYLQNHWHVIYKKWRCIYAQGAPGTTANENRQAASNHAKYIRDSHHLWHETAQLLLTQTRGKKNRFRFKCLLFCMSLLVVLTGLLRTCLTLPFYASLLCATVKVPRSLYLESRHCRVCTPYNICIFHSYTLNAEVVWSSDIYHVFYDHYLLLDMHKAETCEKYWILVYIKDPVTVLSISSHKYRHLTKSTCRT